MALFGTKTKKGKTASGGGLVSSPIPRPMPGTVSAPVPTGGVVTPAAPPSVYGPRGGGGGFGGTGGVSGGGIKGALSSTSGGNLGSSTGTAGIAYDIAGALGDTANPIKTSTAMQFKHTQWKTTETIDVITGDLISVAETRIQNGQFQPILDSGVHSFRPEIILNAEFNTLWETGELTYKDGVSLRKNSSTGDYINFQFQTKQLRQETLSALIKNIQDTLASPKIFDNVKKEYNDQLNAVGQDLGYFENIVSNIAIIKNAFDIKGIPASNYDTISGDTLTKTHTLRQLFFEKLNFTTEQFDVFSDTKILLQMIFDLNRLLSAYSVNLIDLQDNDRANDFSPVKIDRTYNTTNSFEFNINNFSTPSDQASINASEESFFTGFLNSLPPNPNDRIKLLTYLLAKEYSMSRGLGDSTNQTLLQHAGYSRTRRENPFKNILGVVGDTIFESPIGVANSLASLMFIDSGLSNVKVLTFESKFVDSDDQQYTHVPGTSFFVDSILTVDGKAWNANPLTSYVDRYNTTLRSVRTLIESVAGIYTVSKPRAGGATDTVSSDIDPIKMNEMLLLAMKSALPILASSTISTLKTIGSGDQSATTFKKMLLEREIEALNNVIAAYNSIGRGHETSIDLQIAGYQAQINALNIPSLDDTTKMPLDNATIIAIFDIANSRSVLKRQLFEFCLLAGMVRNSAGTSSGNIFSLLAQYEILDTDGFSFRQFSTRSTAHSTSDGANLLSELKRSADAIQLTLERALDSMFGTLGRQPLFEGTVRYYVQKGSFSELLINCALGDGPTGDSNLIYQFVTLANQFFNSGKISDQNVHINLDANLSTTRYNNLSCSTQLLFIFEILCQYVQSYGGVKFISMDNKSDNIAGWRENVPQSNSGVDGYGTHAAYKAENAHVEINPIGISINHAALNKTAQAIDLLINSSSEGDKKTARAQNNTSFLSLEANKSRIESEYNTIRDILSNFKVIGDNLQSSVTVVQNFFNQKSLQDFLKNSPITNLNLLQNYSQLRLASYIYNDIKERTATPNSFVSNFGGNKKPNPSTQNDLIISETTTPSEYNALVSALSDTNNISLQCLPSTELTPDIIKRNNKILTIGIPAGFSRQLADRVNKSQITTQSFKDKQSDVIVLNVHLRNLRFNDIVFKPFKYVFDLSLFATKKDFVDCNVMSGESINNIINRINLTDLDSPFNPQKITRDKILTDQKYDFLNDAQKNDIVKNHITSYLLGIYLQYITGVKTCEEIFLEPANFNGRQTQLSDKASTIVDAYSKQIYGITPNTGDIKDILISSTLPEGLKDTYRMLAYGSLVFNNDEVRNKVLTPKSFDRIFNVPVNVNNAEIDYASSHSATSWSRPYVQDYIRTIGEAGHERYYINAHEIDDFIINDMFIAIETANDTAAQDTAAPYRVGATVAPPPPVTAGMALGLGTGAGPRPTTTGTGTVIDISGGGAHGGRRDPYTGSGRRL